MRPIFRAAAAVLACPKTELERNILKWLWWHPGPTAGSGTIAARRRATPLDGQPPRRRHLREWRPDRLARPSGFVDSRWWRARAPSSHHEPLNHPCCDGDGVRLR